MKGLLVALLLSATGQKVGTPVEFDVSARKVTATGSTTARALRDRFSDVVNVKDYGAVGNGVADDTAAIQAALATCGAEKPGVVYLPKGRYKVTTLTVPSWCSLVGAGPDNAILRPLNDNANVIVLDTSSGGYQVALENFQVWGNAAGTGHGIYGAFGSGTGPSGLRIRDVYVNGMGGDGLHFDALWNATLDNVQASNSLGHQFFIRQAINTVALYNCYARTVPTAGKAGFRVEEGQATLVNCNGIDGGTHWGIFGAELADGDDRDAQVRMKIDGCNVEDFTDTGITLKKSSKLTIDATDFMAPAAGTVRAFYSHNFGNDFPVVWGPANRVLSKGAAWSNGFAVHVLTPPGIIKFGVQDFTTVWDSDGGTSQGIPALAATDGSTGLRVVNGLILGTNAVGSSRIRTHLTGTASWAPNVANGSVSSTTVAVTNSGLGDTVVVGFNVTGGVPAGVTISGSVTVAGTVTVTVRNDSGGAWNPGSGTLRADVWQH